MKRSAECNVEIDNRRFVSRRHPPLFGWPGWRHLVEAFLLAVAVTVWFGVVYGTADLVTGWRAHRVRVHLDRELAIPFVPVMLLCYMSIYPLFWTAPFILRTRSELRGLAAAMAFVTGCGGVGFLLVPAELAFTPPEVPARWLPLFRIADGLNLEYNLVPSLHVALAALCVDVFARRATRTGKIFFRAWGAAIVASTVLTHQHHLADVAAGLVLGLAVACGVYPRWAGSARSNSAAQPVQESSETGLRSPAFAPRDRQRRS